MREKLVQDVRSLFQNMPDTPRNRDLQEEILQNTLDRYDDLIAQGKSPQAAYSLAISGIGDINEILIAQADATPVEPQPVSQAKPGADEPVPTWKKALRAVAVALYILCPIPLFIASEIGMPTLGLCALLAVVAVATAMMVVSSKNNQSEEPPRELTQTEKQRKSIKTIINTIGLVVYFLLSFTTGMWTITWLVFPIIAAIWELAKAILDLKEAKKHEI